MVTEEALPSYSMSLNGLVRDEEGNGPAPWARWLRGWTAEENRHGDLLNAYLRLTGRVDMRAIERTVHALIVNGFNPKSRADPYNLLVYTSFQERATRISHRNVGRMAARDGDLNLARICGVIAGDEARHEAFYTRMMSEVLHHDPAGGILAFRSMLRGTIAMPGRFMDDGKDPDSFDHFAVVAQRTNVYTVRDYASIIEHLVTAWDIAGRSVTGEAARAQEELCRQSERYAAGGANRCRAWRSSRPELQLDSRSKGMSRRYRQTEGNRTMSPVSTRPFTREQVRLRERFGPWAVITGASDGIGREFAGRLAEAGVNRVLAARRKGILEDVANGLARDHGVQVESMTIDLATSLGVDELVARTHGRDVGLLVASAGFETSGPFVDASAR